ncbi:MAG: histidine--tRNA ligase [Sphaerochaetaceae bacterium]
MIQPKVLKGFRDSKPEQELVKKEVIKRLEEQFALFGFVPIDTPVLEYKEILLGKGGGETDKQIFHFVDNGKREVALRFDLTIPFARFVAANFNELTFPFKRSHIAKVWRGENPQRGRFREFIQCDFDIVGVDSQLADLEILSLMQAAFRALNIEEFTIKVAHRQLFNNYLEKIGVQDNSVEILRTVDKLAKIGKQEVLNLLEEITGDKEKASLIFAYIDISSSYDTDSAFVQLEKLVGKENEHLQRLESIFGQLKELNIEKYFKFDSSITRGLDYYTGIVFETFLNELPDIGSVCSGGRYNDLASLYTKHHLPGVGSSIGLDRLLAALEALDSPLFEDFGSSELLLINDRADNESHLLKLSASLRAKGIRNEIYLQSKKALQQFKYAENNKIPYALFITDEKKFSLRNLKERKDLEFKDFKELVEYLKRK